MAYMLTSIGKFLRKLRIDQGEILKDMADKLGVTVSFLSAVENGKKRMPSAWNEKICDLYHLDVSQRSAFTAAIAETEESIEMNFFEVAMGRRELAVSFARKFRDIDDEQAEAIKKILQGGKE
jgi:transcriptional regulator with XRE-family HTH domain